LLSFEEADGTLFLTMEYVGGEVLDFGLAKLHDGVHSLAHASTATVPLTGEGHIIRTVAYMSPEQAQERRRTRDRTSSP
jgi:hypothetical protein